MDNAELNIQGAICQPRNSKLLGAYYTPQELCQILANWAIRSRKDNILEPSFGGCCFLEASIVRLKNLGNRSPNSNIYGCDIDNHAFDHLYNKVGISQISKRFLNADFLSLVSSSFSLPKFDVVAGNPPYISHHNTSIDQKEIAVKAIEHHEIKLDKRASLWAYFVLHSLSFLLENGRMAWVLPGSFLQADYAFHLREHLSKRFRRAITIIIQKRLFLSEGTKENSLIFLGDGFRASEDNCDIEIAEACSLSDLSALINRWAAHERVGEQLGQNPYVNLMGKEASKVYSALAKHATCRRLGEILNIKIGTVTGANDFFVMDRQSAVNNNIFNYVKPILAKFGDAPGMSYLNCDHEHALENNKKCLIVNHSFALTKGSPLRKYLAKFPRKARRTNSTFKKRSKWYAADDGRIPDAFLSYMSSNGPRLVLNKYKTNCTNTIHRGYFLNKVSLASKQLLAISLLTTFSQLTAEIEGRSYGSGVLKLEPSGMKKMKVLLPDFDRETIFLTYKAIDQELRSGNVKKAMELADGLIFQAYKQEFSSDFIAELNQALQIARARRLAGRRR